MKKIKVIVKQLIENWQSSRLPRCPIYQNVDAKPYTDPERIMKNLLN